MACLLSRLSVFMAITFGFFPVALISWDSAREVENLAYCNRHRELELGHHWSRQLWGGKFVCPVKVGTFSEASWELPQRVWSWVTPSSGHKHRKCQEQDLEPNSFSLHWGHASSWGEDGSLESFVFLGSWLRISYNFIPWSQLKFSNRYSELLGSLPQVSEEYFLLWHLC